ncbi:hypothetical protein AGOR_G00144030 [Albula goreensis]|uniref:Uncharacterized protein n=1 Tax=Albula goreensis TaxID=1534307 RepID=A0A8T3D1E6_9TELE|nr:hypothetical protein AGOR_G00144030 [Albula goreensis]
MSQTSIWAWHAGLPATRSYGGAAPGAERPESCPPPSLWGVKAQRVEKHESRKAVAGHIVITVVEHKTASTQVASFALSQEEASLVADYLTHLTTTAEKHYRMWEAGNVVRGSALLQRLAGDSV